jgi:hypothetical protein
MKPNHPRPYYNRLPTGELDALASEYTLTNGSKLGDFERSAILKGIQAELDDRIAPWKSGFRFASEIERLQVALEAKEDEIFQLEFKISMLEDELQAAKKGKSKKQG